MIVSQGNNQTLMLPIGMMLTVVSDTGGTGSIVRLGDNDGQESQGYTSITSAQTKTFGPYALSTKWRVESATANLTYSIAQVDFPTAAEALAAANPMTAAGDMIIGGANGLATRLPKGTDGQVLTLVSGVPTWV